ncbi:MAG: TadE/TadG family type IV pilus assembly protein [Zhongshania sp.]|uniref:TadE/TadG family type IV pilus assembly protein n=1 Tax=Zhongshania sp. TaxID=1971902 RepID=UPI00261B3650|nr:TadE/TadG family type IV pilus assembly protein [Zhongshania sp.]MDF1691046.1 TadE/TadG family type IV pilus assembly protein [Zhongshania sp.]
MANRNFSRAKQRRQKGAVAIEFVFIFPVFFIICYAIIVYGLAFLLVQNFTYSSEEVLRMTLSSCDDCETAAEWQLELAANANSLAIIDSTSSLLVFRPDNLTATACCADEDGSTCGGAAVTVNGVLCEVSISAAPLLDGITMPGFGKLPSLPNKLAGKASLLF